MGLFHSTMRGASQHLARGRRGFRTPQTDGWIVYGCVQIHTAFESGVQIWLFFFFPCRLAPERYLLRSTRSWPTLFRSSSMLGLPFSDGQVKHTTLLIFSCNYTIYVRFAWRSGDANSLWQCGCGYVCGGVGGEGVQQTCSPCISFWQTPQMCFFISNC